MSTDIPLGLGINQPSFASWARPCHPRPLLSGLRRGCWIRCAARCGCCTTAFALSRRTCTGARPSFAFMGCGTHLEMGGDEVCAFLTGGRSIADTREGSSATRGARRSRWSSRHEAGRKPRRFSIRCSVANVSLGNCPLAKGPRARSGEALHGLHLMTAHARSGL